MIPTRSNSQRTLLAEKRPRRLPEDRIRRERGDKAAALGRGREEAFEELEVEEEETGK